MDAVSQLPYRHVRSQWLRLLAVLAAVWLLALLAFVVGALGASQIAPADGQLIGPFRWPSSPGLG